MFEIKIKLNELEDRSNMHVNRIVSFHSFATFELSSLNMKVCKKSLSFMAANSKEAKKTISKSVSRKIEIYDKYSFYNIFVWLKRFYRSYEKYENQLSSYKNVTRDILKDLYDLHKEIKNNYNHYSISDSLLERIEFIKSELDKTQHLELENYKGYKLIEDCMTFYQQTINKNDFLSLLSLLKDKSTIDIIASYPEQLSIRELTELVFIHRIEEDNDCYLFEYTFQHTFDYVRNNKADLKQLLPNDKPLPTFNVKFDDWGNVEEIKQNKPTLTRVK